MRGEPHLYSQRPEAEPYLLQYKQFGKRLTLFPEAENSHML